MTGRRAECKLVAPACGQVAVAPGTCEEVAIEIGSYSWGVANTGTAGSGGGGGAGKAVLQDVHFTSTTFDAGRFDVG